MALARLLLVLLPVLAVQGSRPAPPPDLYRRVVDKAVERVQGELVSAAKFEVDHSRFEDPWIVTTEHYEVKATVSYAQTKKLADGLEFVRGEMVKLLGPGRNQPARSKVWIFPTMGDYNRFGQGNGAEHSSLLGGFYSTQNAEHPVASYQNGNDFQVGMWITHGAVHQFLEESFGQQVEVWVDEGLASYFALFWDWSFGAHELARLQQTRRFVPLEHLVRDPIQAYAANPDDRFIELGMLFHYLLNFAEGARNGATGDPATGPFQEFLRAAVRGQDTSQLEFVQTFEEAAALLEEDFKKFDFSAH